MRARQKVLNRQRKRKEETLKAKRIAMAAEVAVKKKK